jgi:hypothetical protein
MIPPGMRSLFLLIILAPDVFGSPIRAVAAEEPMHPDGGSAVLLPAGPVSQIIRASDWAGAVNVTDGGCNASMGEYTLWVYATETACGVAREEADRVVVIRQPLPGVAPIRATTQLAAGTYTVWVYGAGDAGQLRLCAKICIVGALSPTPVWASIGEIEIRDNQSLILRTWQQPEGHIIHVQAMVLSSDGAKPDWIP